MAAVALPVFVTSCVGWAAWGCLGCFVKRKKRRHRWEHEEASSDEDVEAGRSKSDRRSKSKASKSKHRLKEGTSVGQQGLNPENLEDSEKVRSLTVESFTARLRRMLLITGGRAREWRHAMLSILPFAQQKAWRNVVDASPGAVTIDIEDLEARAKSLEKMAEAIKAKKSKSKVLRIQDSATTRTQEHVSESRSTAHLPNSTSGRVDRLYDLSAVQASQNQSLASKANTIPLQSGQTAPAPPRPNRRDTKGPRASVGVDPNDLREALDQARKQEFQAIEILRGDTADDSDVEITMGGDNPTGVQKRKKREAMESRRSIRVSKEAQKWERREKMNWMNNDYIRHEACRTLGFTSDNDGADSLLNLPVGRPAPLTKVNNTMVHHTRQGSEVLVAQQNLNVVEIQQISNPASVDSRWLQDAIQVTGRPKSEGPQIGLGDGKRRTHLDQQSVPTNVGKLTDSSSELSEDSLAQ